MLGWEDVNTILDTDGYSPERRVFIVDMMKKFELCYESEGFTSTYLIPDLLTKEEPDTGDWTDALQFEITYGILPSSIISRLIVRMHTHISKGTVWRTGAVFSMDRNWALVRGDREDGLIKIAVTGPPNGRRGLLTAIRSELRAIDQTIPGLTGKERVPVPGHTGYWVSYDHLLNLEEAGHQDVVPEGLTEYFAIRELLAGIEEPGDRHWPPSGSLPPPQRRHRHDSSSPTGRDDTETPGRQQLPPLGQTLGWGVVAPAIASATRALTYRIAPSAASPPSFRRIWYWDPRPTRPSWSGRRSPRCFDRSNLLLGTRSRR